MKSGWPIIRKEYAVSIMEFYNHRDEMSYEDGVIFRGQTIVFPEGCRAELIKKAHFIYMGTRCNVLCRPFLNCPICLSNSASNCKRSMVSYTIATLPWQYIHSDLFHFDGNAKFA